MSSEMEDLLEDDVFKILIATDIHLGYQLNEREGVEAVDSFTTFEEILQYGKEYKVDFILFGGDLFHNAKPSPAVMTKCMELLRKYCFGSGDIKIEFLTDPDAAFENCCFKNVNYEDPNMNISMPIFSIHGSNDVPSCESIGPMDTLSVAGLINYFGKYMDLSKIELTPIILKKGRSYIALYGLGYVNDRRLSKLIMDNKFEIKKPKDMEECFNMLVLHQSRKRHEHNDFIPEKKLPSDLDLVIWGHEHECRIQPETVVGTEYYILQPGSSVATSMCESEALPKHVGILYVNRLQFRVKKLKLKTVRPFVYDTITLQNHPDLEERLQESDQDISDVVMEFIDNHIENNLISKAATKLSGHKKQPHLPLIKLKVLYNDENQLFDTIPLAKKYSKEVANPKDMILFRKNMGTATKHGDSAIDEWKDLFPFESDVAKWSTSIQEGMSKFFDAEENKDALTVLSIEALNQALDQYVGKNDTDAFDVVISHQTNEITEYLEQQNIKDPEEILDKIKDFRDKKRENAKEEQAEIASILNDKILRAQLKANRKKDTAKEVLNDCNDNNGESMEHDAMDSARGKTRGRGRGTTSRDTSSRGKRSRGSAKK